MFHLIKKDKDKEKDGTKNEKKEKKEKKERMSQAELNSLEEMSVRRGFFNLHRSSSKREAKGKLEISSPIPIKVVRNTELSLTDADLRKLYTQGTITPTSSSDDIKLDQDVRRTSIKEQAVKYDSMTKQNSPVEQILKQVFFLTEEQRRKPFEGQLYHQGWTPPFPHLR